MCDVNSGHQQSFLVAFTYIAVVVDRITREIMPERCVVYGCSNTGDVKEGISLHVIPFYGEKVGRFCSPNTRKMEPNVPISDMLEAFQD